MIWVQIMELYWLYMNRWKELLMKMEELQASGIPLPMLVGIPSLLLLLFILAIHLTNYGFLISLEAFLNSEKGWIFNVLYLSSEEILYRLGWEKCFLFSIFYFYFDINYKDSALFSLNSNYYNFIKVLEL